MSATANGKPIFVPVALPLAEAEEVFAAVSAVFRTACTIGEARSERAGCLARAMVTLAGAIDEARGTADA
jgi:hypothetical protein